jgi:hypothetical protein
MLRLLHMYNELQDHILNTQQSLNMLYRRQSRIEHFILRMSQSEHLNNENTLPNNINNNINGPIIYDNMNNNIMNNNNNNINSSNTESVTLDVSASPVPLQEQSPINNVFSNIFNNIPNFLPTHTISSLNRNFRNPSGEEKEDDGIMNSNNNHTNHNNSDEPRYIYENVYANNYLYNRNSNRLFSGRHRDPHLTDNINEYNTIIYRPLRENGRIDWGSLTNSHNSTTTTTAALHNSETFTPNQLVESLLSAIMNYQTTIDSSNEEQMLTNDEIITYIQSCEFKDIINPLNTICPITMEPFQMNTVVMKLRNCGHIFSEPELRQWISFKRICPICRHNITQP